MDTELDVETEKLLKNAGISTEEPDDVLAIQEPQREETNPSAINYSTSQYPAELTQPMWGLGQKKEEEKKRGLIITNSTFGDTVLALGGTIFYGQLMANYNSEVAVGSNAAANVGGAWLAYRAMTDPSLGGVERALAGVATVFMGLTGGLSIVDLMRNRPPRKLKPVTIPKLLKKMTK